MMSIGDGVVKYKQRLRVEPSAIQLEEAVAKAAPAKEESGSRKLIPVKHETPKTKESEKGKEKENPKTKESEKDKGKTEPAQASRPIKAEPA